MTIRNLLMIVSLVLSVLIGFAVGGRGGGGAGGGGSSGDGQGVTRPGRIIIGLSLDTLKEERWQSDRDLFVKRCRELGAEVKVQAANSDDSQQIKDVESLISAGCRVIVMVPHDGAAMAQAVEIAHKAGVPVIAYDRLIRDCDLDLYLSFDNVRVGELQAQYLVDHLPTPGKGRIVRIYGAPSDNNAKLFKQGQDNVLKPYIDRGDIKVVREDWAEEWRADNAKKIVNAALSGRSSNAGDPGFDAILASNDGTAGGAIQSLTEDGLAGKVLVTGQDAELAACQRIIDGTQTMTVYKPLKVLATRSAEAAVQMASGKPIVARQTVNNGKVDVPSILADIYVTTRQNMVQTVIKDALRSYDEVYRNVPEKERPQRP